MPFYYFVLHYAAGSQFNLGRFDESILIFVIVTNPEEAASEVTCLIIEVYVLAVGPVNVPLVTEPVAELFTNEPKLEFA